MSTNTEVGVAYVANDRIGLSLPDEYDASDNITVEVDWEQLKMLYDKIGLVLKKYGKE